MNAGQLVVEVADTIHNRIVPEGTQLEELIIDLIKYALCHLVR